MCKDIVANVKMEECYSGLSLTFDGSEALQIKIGNVIDSVIKQTKMTPTVFDNSKNPEGSKPAFYIEFSDEVQRESGYFFELVLKELKIDKCINDVV